MIFLDTYLGVKFPGSWPGRISGWIFKIELWMVGHWYSGWWFTIANCSQNLWIENWSTSIQCKSLHIVRTSHFICDSFGCKLWLQSIQNYAKDRSQGFACSHLKWLCCLIGMWADFSKTSRRYRSAALHRIWFGPFGFVTMSLVLVRDQWMIARFSVATTLQSPGLAESGPKATVPADRDCLCACTSNQPNLWQSAAPRRGPRAPSLIWQSKPSIVGSDCQTTGRGWGAQTWTQTWPLPTGLYCFTGYQAFIKTIEQTVWSLNSFLVSWRCRNCLKQSSYFNPYPRDAVQCGMTRSSF